MVALQQIIDKLKHQCNRHSTDKVYYQVWKSFNQFIIKLDTKPKTWEDRLVLYIGYLIHNNRKSNTICSYVSGIKSVLRKDGVFLNENKYLLNSLIKVCRIHRDQVTTQLPIRKGLMNLLVNAVPQICPDQPYLATLYQAMISTAYFGLFRIGEITYSQHVVKARDVHIAKNKDKITFILHTSKTHGRDKKPQIVKIERHLQTDRKGPNSACPFLLLRDYFNTRKKAKNTSEPLFVFRDRSPVQPCHFRKVLKQA